MADALPCLLCERALPAEPSARALTDCAHEFCLSCLCRALAARKNRCPACGAAVRAVHQLQAEQAAAPASVRFCNATYVLNVSIWDVQDPARVLAGLFNLEHARLIHRGKLLKKGDVWPGTLVQLFGTIKSSSGAGAAGGRDGVLASLTSSTSWLQQFLTSPRVRQILCCPCSVLLDFVRSLFGGGELEREQRGYRRVATADVEAGPSSRFHEPGRVSAPPSTDSL